MSDARDVIGKCVGARLHDPFGHKQADAILSALSAMPLASRLALARALVPGWAVVPREATDAIVRAAARLDWSSQTDPTWREFYTAMLTAAEEPPHGS